MVSDVDRITARAREDGLTPKQGDVIRLKYGEADGALLRVTNEPKTNGDGEITLDVERVWSCGRCGDRFPTEDEAQRHADTCTSPPMRVVQAM